MTTSSATPAPSASQQSGKIADPTVGHEVIVGLVIFFLLLTVIPLKRRRKKRALHAPPVQRREARRKLGHVAEKEDGWFDNAECAICLAPLITYITPERTGTGTVDGETQPSPDSQHRPIVYTEEVLMLRVCQHAFHGSCLTSWFLIERYDCPICRLTYFRHGKRQLLGLPERCRRLLREMTERANNEAH
ncbi:hypothetical protein CC80DRAFT_506950 [Byssothecium circinans]|uniref:RING-type domain-containing protein n=1 Tax=Byssothecium circinans TaxID=147558 RepID=A0A6A5TMX7_9PLEO|nr:hypothetical protein CC80DRAFT_506950 [Byssothecium circinans]